ncbi:MAG: hypothetical protein H0V20_07185 [Actinobacteria bacterium]|nr:hypothetical protein [Actinomycetota bacterium]
MLQPVDPNERFRSRRAKARTRRAARRVSALAVVALAAAGVALGARFLTEGERAHRSADKPAESASAEKPEKPTPRPLPDELRGVHVTMALLTLDGKLDEYLSYTKYGLTALELDVKDENGEVAFTSRYAPLAKRVGSARNYYRPGPVVAKIRAKGLYLIGRVVAFEDPFLSEKRPDLAIRQRGGGVWRNDAGLGWTNPYDKRVWDYNVDIAESAARVGFDEIMFDYVRFPSDGNVDSAVFPGKRAEPKARTIADFLAYARSRLSPLGVRVSAAVFGLSATRNLGIGQRPRLIAEHVDAIYPMVYPSHYSLGEYGIDDPNARPGATVAASLRDFSRAMRGTDATVVPWLQDFSLGRTYSLYDVEAQIRAARRMQSAGFLLWNAAGVYTPEALAGP